MGSPSVGGPSSHTAADALGVTPPAPLAFDALTDLFLGGSARTALGAGEPVPTPQHTPHAHNHAPTSAPRTTPALHVSGNAVTAELLVAGHLPVMASAWVQQYARDRAGATNAPVALVDIRSGRAWVQVLDPKGQFIAEAGSTLPGSLRAVKTVVRTWMIRVDEVDEGAMRAAAPGAAVTLLSGADQAATVGAYRALKRLAAAGARPESVAIAIMGAERADADHAVDRVAAAAKSFLGVTVTGAAVSPKVDASLRPVTAFAGPLPASGSPGAIKLLADALTPAAAPVQEDDDADDVIATPAAPVHHQGATTGRSGPAVPGVIARSPEPQAIAVAAKAPASQLLTDVAPLAEAPLHALLSGLEPLPARCPAAPSVKLASDAQGRLHLISIDLAGAADPVAPHIERLLAASAWATENHELLRVAFPRLSAVAERTPPVLHLAVDQPKRVRHLLDTSVRLHVLATPGQGSRGWVARALN